MNGGNVVFENEIKKYFKVGRLYWMPYSGKIVKCTGFTHLNSKCLLICRDHKLFGQCDGCIKPTFDRYPTGHCAHDMSGEHWFIPVLNTNERW